MAKQTDGGYVRPEGYKPWDTETGTGMDGFFKSEAWGVWEKAAKTLDQVGSLLGNKARSIPADKLKNYDTRFSRLNTDFNSRWADVKSYDPKWTRWGKYIDEGLVFQTQFVLLRDEINSDIAANDTAAAAAAKKQAQDAAAADTSGAAKRKTKNKTTQALAENGGDPEAAADQLAKTGNVASTPAKPVDPFMVGLIVAGVLLVGASIWAFLPTKSGAVAGLGKYRKTRRSHRRRK